MRLNADAKLKLITFDKYGKIFMKQVLFSLILTFVIGFVGYTQPKTQILYKQIDTTALYLDVFYPDKYDSKSSYPAIVFFFGGGWTHGSVKQFEPHAKYFSDKGMVCFLVDYRVESRQKSTPFESLKDAKSAMRYVRGNAKELGIDPNRIVASGGSAGGQLAAATALIELFNEESDDLSVSCIPNALILFNPVIDNGPGGFGFELIDEKYKDFSPIHNIKKGAPPTLFFLGTQDKLIPIETAKYYKTVMEKVGSRCDLMLFEGEGHGFFNYEKTNNYKRTITNAEFFLRSLGYLKNDD